MKTFARRVFFVMGMLAVLLACSREQAPATAHAYMSLASNDNIRYEQGMVYLARVASAMLPTAIAAVEKLQALPFRDAAGIRIFINNKDPEYQASKTRDLARMATVQGNDILLDLNSDVTPDEVRMLLERQLSLMHMREHAGDWVYDYLIPDWFITGLSIHAANDGMVELARQDIGKTWLISGRHFTPVEYKVFRYLYPAARYGLTRDMHDRQASLFVEYLDQRNPAAFHESVRNVLQGVPFGNCWEPYYQETLQQLWLDFLDDLYREKGDQESVVLK